MTEPEGATLLDDLRKAEAENNQRLAPGRVGCAWCAALDTMSPDVRIAVQYAIGARTIGRDKLVSIVQANGYEVGRRSFERHRDEGHTL